jgi:hypothetical protein
MVIIERLFRAAKRGVRVRIMSRALHKLKNKKLFERCDPSEPPLRLVDVLDLQPDHFAGTLAAPINKD